MLCLLRYEDMEETKKMQRLFLVFILLKTQLMAFHNLEFPKTSSWIKVMFSTENHSVKKHSI